MPSLQSTGSILAALAGIAAFLRRREPIGGWLFYFFCQVALGLFLVGAGTHWKLYLPRAGNEPARYFLITLSNLSRTALLAAIAVVCVRLAATREWQWVCSLRYALATYAFLTVLRVWADIYYFPEAVNRDTLSLAFPCVWIVYFRVSRRVRCVFPEHIPQDSRHGNQ